MMPQSIESFVEKLHAEGVQAGQVDAESIREEARRQARDIIDHAQENSKQIVVEARSQAHEILARGNGELALAARDALNKLRETLAHLLQNVLAAPVAEHLQNPDFLAPLLHDIVMQYARTDSEGAWQIDVNVSADLAAQLSEWAINELRQAAKNHNAGVNLHGTLQKAGFEYKLDGATIDVTVDSVVETLTELIGPHFRKLIESNETKTKD